MSQSLCLVTAVDAGEGAGGESAVGSSCSRILHVGAAGLQVHPTHELLSPRALQNNVVAGASCATVARNLGLFVGCPNP